MGTTISCSEGDLFWPSPVTKTNLHKIALLPANFCYVIATRVLDLVGVRKEGVRKEGEKN